MLQKLKSLRMAFTNAYTIIVAQLVEQFRFVRRRHSPTISAMTAILSHQVSNSTRIRRMLATALVICVAALVGIAAAEEPKKCAVWGAIPKKP
jgi:hypothetical protein